MRVSRGALLAGGVGIAAAGTLVARRARRRRHDTATNTINMPTPAPDAGAKIEDTTERSPREPGDLTPAT